MGKVIVLFSQNPSENKSWKLVDYIILTGIIFIIVLLTRRFELNYHWNWQVILDYAIKKNGDTYRAGPLLQGLWITIKLAIWSLLLALPLGTFTALLSYSKWGSLRFLAKIYVLSIRNIPPLVLMLIFYYFFADQLFNALGLEASVRQLHPEQKKWLQWFFYRSDLLGSFFSAVLALALYEGAYIYGIVRGGLLAIPRLQHYAAVSLGLSYWQKQRLIILPQVRTKVLPALAGQFISTIKDSSIVSVVSMAELTFQTTQIMTTTQAFFEASFTALVLYFVLTFSTSLILKKLCSLKTQ